jgi:molecular chaperone GrpE
VVSGGFFCPGDSVTRLRGLDLTGATSLDTLFCPAYCLQQIFPALASQRDLDINESSEEESRGPHHTRTRRQSVTDEAKDRQTVEVEGSVGNSTDTSDAEFVTTETSPGPEALQEQLEESCDRLMRLAAEFENYKKRMERERSRFLKYAGENILLDLLTTVDNIDRAVEQGNVVAADDGKKLMAMIEGLELTRKGLLTTMERYGVEPLESIGQPFNPDEHDAMVMEPSNEVPANHVLQEFAKGYRFKDRVLRHARVVVSSGPAGAC